MTDCLWKSRVRENREMLCTTKRVVNLLNMINKQEDAWQLFLTIDLWILPRIPREFIFRSRCIFCHSFTAICDTDCKFYLELVYFDYIYENMLIPFPWGLSGVLKILVPATPAIGIFFFTALFVNFFQVACFSFCSVALAARTSIFFSFFLFFLSPPFLILPNLILSYLFDLGQPIYSFDYREKWPVAIAEMAKWIEEGKLKRRFTVVDGLDKAYDALNMLFAGGNTGKTWVVTWFDNSFFSFSPLGFVLLPPSLFLPFLGFASFATYTRCAAKYN